MVESDGYDGSIDGSLESQAPQLECEVFVEVMVMGTAIMWNSR
jgi:hypothetical protein